MLSAMSQNVVDGIHKSVEMAIGQVFDYLFIE
jgi:hypothetical protein